MLTRRWLPGDTANAIEAKQAEFRAEPEIPIGRLGNRVDVAQGEPIPDGPRRMRVLADVERGIQREAATAACHENAQQDGNSSHYRLSWAGSLSIIRWGRHTPSTPSREPLGQERVPGTDNGREAVGDAELEMLQEC